MLKTYLYITDQLNRQVILAAKTQNKSKAEIIRTALEKGILTINYQATASARALLKLAKMGEGLKAKGPKDLSVNLDGYLWGMSKD